jgi:hypothetical protein
MKLTRFMRCLFVVNVRLRTKFKRRSDLKAKKSLCLQRFLRHPKISPTQVKNADCDDEENASRVFALHSPICSEVEVSDRELYVARSVVLCSV